ncbi:hypothetical protein BKA58DRAFT_423775 [Alternaria rosae]|uniref:uncharacterized protein n=1 Tax=Alternaria rosae TaxID=1187941 RepID=UPI001E8E14D5|nr:uncharacterized protein BKA58DRAFT_423775 [Alternaria rosae]KAH6860656.1 hypothetical protein BKA58DRAFT_423775 [Alternaria rosae]
MSMSKYDTILWEKEMKKQITSHARALFGAYPYGSDFDIIHTYSRDEQDKEMPYNIHLIVYKRPHKSEEWERAHSVDGNVDVAQGLSRLLESMRVGLGWKLDKPRSKPPASDRNDDVDNAPKGSWREGVDDDGRREKRRRSRR